MLEGLKLTFAGMSMVLSFLVLLIGIMNLSSWLFKPQQTQKIPTYPNEKESSDISPNMVAAISTAIEAYEADSRKGKL